MTKQTQVSLSPALRRRRLTETGIGYLFIGPWLFCFLAFNLVPFVISFVLSFMDYNMLSAPTFVGLSNYVKLFTGDKLFKTSLGVTFRFVFIAIPLRLAFALLVALILNRQSKMVPLYRVVYYLPSILGGSVAVSVMWRYCFSKTGVLNTALQAIGIASNISWISNKDTALWSLILLFIWQFGSPMLIFLSGLKQIPKSYYEAAECDGRSQRCPALFQDHASPAHANHLLQSGYADDRWIHGLFPGHDYYGRRSHEPYACLCPVSIQAVICVL